MRNWIFSIQTTVTVVVFSGVASVLLLCGVDNQPQEVLSSAEKPNCVRASEGSVILDPALERSIQFQKLRAEWHQQRGSMAWVVDLAMCPGYQKIIGMGPPAVPLILSQLKFEGDEPDHWFWALRVITGANPVAQQDQGNVLKMAEAWLRWGAQEGHVG